jgi:lipoprotein NlpD
LRIRRSIGTVGLCCLLLGACADITAEGPETYVVRAQDTLYSIAWRHDLDFRDLARWNNIGADFHISIGQVLLLGPGPAPPGDGAPRRPPSTDAQPAHQPRPLPRGTPPVPREVPRALALSAARGWVWPTDAIGAAQPVPSGGILLSGRLGQDVRAANDGRVVYTGSGLRGYGNLIIIKHADSLLSAYAHNREMLVHDGEEVTAGSVIARMGEGAQHSATLYFEIRLNGKPIDPLPFFSK